MFLYFSLLLGNAIFRYSSNVYLCKLISETWLPNPFQMAPYHDTEIQINVIAIFLTFKDDE